MKKLIAFSAGVVLYVFLAIILTGYSNDPMHKYINEEIFELFKQQMGDYPELAYYSIDDEKVKGLAVTKKAFISIEESDRSMTMREWLIHGGMSGDEPEALMALRHFYDPQGIDNGKKYLTDFPLGIQYGNPKVHILEWALEYNGEVTKGTTGTFPLKQIYSWEDGKRSMILAMNTLDEEQQSRYFAEAWRSLGESLHALGDLACPVHVRNDGHPVSDPDPFEDGIIERNNIPADPSYYWDPTLINRMKNTDSIRQLFHDMAEYTNKNFFTNQTIWGKSKIGYIDPVIRPHNPYAFPYLYEDDLGWSYDENSYTFSRDYGGTNTKMCKDRYYFEDLIAGYSRSRKAYIDLDVAKSQARVLLSNLIGIGPEVIKRFLPVIEVRITEANEQINVLQGRVTIKSNVEYPNPREFNSWVEVENISTGKKVKISAFQSQFIDNKLAFKNGDKLEASIHLGGIVIKSEIFTVQGLSLRDYIDKSNEVSLTCQFPSVIMSDQESQWFEVKSFDNSDNYYDNVSYSLNGNTLTVVKDRDRDYSTQHFTQHYMRTDEFKFTFNSSFDLIEKLEYKETRTDLWGDRTINYLTELTINDIKMDGYNGQPGDLDSYIQYSLENRDGLKDKLTHFKYVYDWYNDQTQEGEHLEAIRIDWSDPNASHVEECEVYFERY